MQERALNVRASTSIGSSNSNPPGPGSVTSNSIEPKPSSTLSISTSDPIAPKTAITIARTKRPLRAVRHGAGTVLDRSARIGGGSFRRDAAKL